MPIFKVECRLQVPLHAKGVLDPEGVRELCERPSGPLARSGCYVFAVPRKGGKGLLPIYAGKATGSLIKECLSADKITKINAYLLRRPAKAVFLYCITHPIQRGRPNAAAIAQLERFLITYSVEMNPHLINKQGTRPQGWGIAGVIRGGRGRRSEEALELRELLGIDDLRSLQEVAEEQLSASEVEVASGQADLPHG